MQHLGVDPVEVHVLEDHVRITLRHPPTGLAVPGNRPTLEPGRVQPTEDPGGALDKGLDLEVLFPHSAVAQVLREEGTEEVGGL